ncbi:hypothetical protein QBC43DRAFT_335947 [Cladorrhinum sp. PSN259]|nr:hypothetical protein QBC43DRAFT_335947 [Cladorrhinum sp. PSN259]
MRKRSLFSLGCYGLAIIIFSCLPGAWSAPHNTTTDRVSKRDITVKDTSCVGEWEGNVRDALAEAEDIVNFAIQRLATLVTILSSNPVPTIAGMSNADRTVFRTYEAFFGQVYFGTDTAADRRNNVAAMERLQAVLMNAQIVWTALRAKNSAAVNLEIWCDDDFLRDEDPTGVPGIGHNKFDTRKWDDLQIGQWLGMAAGKCSSNAGLSAYTYEFKVLGVPDESVIVLCPAKMRGWAARYSSGDVIFNYHGAPVDHDELKEVDYIWGYLPLTLIHEFTHAETVMGAGNTLVDQPVNGGTAYQWQAIRQLAQQNPQGALTNSDTFSLFLGAIYWNKQDWSTGVAQRLGLTRMGPA